LRAQSKHCKCKQDRIKALKMSIYKASQNINLPQLQNLIKRDPESYRDEVRIFWMFNVCV